MREYLELGPTPAEEDCQQVGTKNYNSQLAYAECLVYKRQLLRLYPNATIGIKGFSHDFGRYYEVVVYYNSKDEKSIDLAYTIENNTPLNWDEIALQELAVHKNEVTNGQDYNTKI